MVKLHCEQWLHTNKGGKVVLLQCFLSNKIINCELNCITKTADKASEVGKKWGKMLMLNKIHAGFSVSPPGKQVIWFHCGNNELLQNQNFKFFEWPLPYCEAKHTINSINNRVFFHDRSFRWEVSYEVSSIILHETESEIQFILQSCEPHSVVTMLSNSFVGQTRAHEPMNLQMQNSLKACAHLLSCRYTQ